MMRHIKFKVLGYVFVIGFGIAGVLLKGTIGDYGQIVILTGLPLGIACFYYSWKIRQDVENKGRRKY